MTMKVEVVGLRETRAAFKELPKELRRELPHALRAVAERVANAVRGKVPVKSGKAAGSVKAKAATTYAGIAVGGPDAPYYKVLDFGSGTAVSGNPRAVGPWHGSGTGPTGGRYLYPTIDEWNREICNGAAEALDHAARKVGFE